MTLSQRIDLGVYHLLEKARGGWHQTGIIKLARDVGSAAAVPSDKLVAALNRLHADGYLELQTYPPGSSTPFAFEGEADQTFFDHEFQIKIRSAGHPYFEKLEQEATKSALPLSDSQGFVFVSCGQYAEHEKQLGKDIVALIEELTPHRAYFADNQEDLQGLTQNIFGALNRCAGFVGVMHHRGDVKTPSGHHQRGSVWIEQEIAIAAFLRQILDHRIEVAVYFQEGIKREGVREQLILNATKFSNENEVLDDLRAKIAAGKFTNQQPSNTVPLDAEFRWNATRRNQHEHRYELSIWFENTGSQPLENYWFDLEFPRIALVESASIGGEIRESATKTHRFFRATWAKQPQTLYPRDKIKLFSGIPYRMTDDMHDKGEVLRQSVILTLNANGMNPKRIEKPFSELQDF